MTQVLCHVKLTLLSVPWQQSRVEILKLSSLISTLTHSTMTVIGAIDAVISRLADAADNVLIPYKSLAVGLLVAQTAFELYIM